MNVKNIDIPLGRRSKKYRFFEMLPALTSYSLLLLPILLSIFNPFLAAVFIIVYIMMWFIKAIAMAYRTISGYSLLQSAQKVNWRNRLQDLDDANASLHRYTQIDVDGWRAAQHLKNLRRVALNSGAYYKSSEVYNAVIIPFVREGRDVLVPTIEYIVNSNYDLKKMILILAPEARAGKASEALAEELLQEYGNKFYLALSAVHPAGLPNEIIGKGGNITFAARQLELVLVEKNIDPDKVIVTTLDSDNRPDPEYFSYVTYEYILDLKHKFRAYQPIALYLNNIWDVPAPMRVMATGNSFWTIINSQRSHMLRNFSSHSQGMSSLIDTNFWSTRTIVEDGHQYWRSYFKFDGDYEVTAIYVPIYQDAVLGASYWLTIKEQFKQLQRWAYGASDVAYVAEMGFNKNRKAPFWPFITRFFRLLDSHVSWATTSIIIALGAWAPLFLSTNADRSIIAHELPIIASQLQQIAMVGMFITIFLSFKMLPPRPERYKRHRNIFMLLQWVLMPITSIVYGSVAAFNSQTRLLLGKYLDRFDDTVKIVKK